MVRTGAVLVAAGASMLLFARPDGGSLMFSLASGIVGAGMGLSSTPVLISLQSEVGWEERGVVTAAFAFCRTMGGTIGVVIAGGVYAARLSVRAVAAPAIDALLRPGAAPGPLDVRAALAWALEGGFVAMAVIGAGMVIAAFAFPRAAVQLRSRESRGQPVPDA
jgi:hypothetical protein